MAVFYSKCTSSTQSKELTADLSSLFRPYIKLDLRAAGLYPRDTCTFCANEISALMSALRAMYGLRRVTLAVTSHLLSASTIHLLNLPSEDAAAHLSQGLHDLEAMSVNHRFAARAVDIIRSLSSKWKIALPESAASVSVYRMHSQREISSPPPSTFFAASIDRKQSSEGKMKSGENSHQESPFGPPSGDSGGSGNQLSHQQQTQQNTSIPTFYSDPTIPMDATQAQTAFWTPFPSQVMPIPQFDLASTMMDLSQLEGQQDWHMYSGTTGAAQPPASQDYHGRQASTPGRLDEAMSGMENWHWQS